MIMPNWSVIIIFTPVSYSRRDSCNYLDLKVLHACTVDVISSNSILGNVCRPPTYPIIVSSSGSHQQGKVVDHLPNHSALDHSTSVHSAPAQAIASFPAASFTSASFMPAIIFVHIPRGSV